MPLNNGQATSKPSMLNAFKALEDCINYNMNCVKVATVLSFDSDTLTAKCRINNKRLKGLQKDGNQILQDYPDIYAKVCFFGWGDIGASHPVVEGMEGILLFNDRELETWFLTGNSGNLAYDRCHDLSDALFICGIQSQPNISLVQYLENALSIYYKTSNIQLLENEIDLNTTTYNISATTQNIAATTIHTGTFSATELNDTTAANGTFTSADGKTITVVNGIIRTIS